MPFKDKHGRRYTQKSNPTGARKFPLRKIVGTKMVPLTLADGTPSEYSLLHEVLECGHTQRPRKDVLGAETLALSRRCKQCARQEGN